MPSKKIHKKVLRRDAEWHRLLHENMSDPFVLVDMKGKIREFNESFRAILGYTEEELLQLTYKDLTPKKWHSYEDRIVREQILPLGGSKVYEKEYRCKDGTILPVELRTFLTRDLKGKKDGMWAIVRDITDRQREHQQLESAMVRLKEVNQRLKLYFDHVPIANIVWDRDFRIVEWNPAAEQIFGWTAEEAIGKRPFQLYIPEDIQQAMALRWQSLIRKRETIGGGVNENVTRDGRRIVCEWFTAPLYDDSFNSTGGIVMAHDITRRIKAEDDIRALNADLERRVVIRTEELTQSVSALKQEARRRERAEASLLVRQKQLVELVSQLIVAESCERRRIADGLHDDVNQMLAAAKLVTGHLGASCKGDMLKSVKDLDRMLDQILKTTRSLTFDLASPVLHRLGLEAALEDLCERIRGDSSMEVVFNSDNRKHPINSEIQDFIFQSVKELLRNVQRHAKATRVKVLLGWVRGGMEVVVLDDGVGPAAVRKSRFNQGGGFGLYAIRERLEYLGGLMRIEKAGEHGTRITLRIPPSPRLQTLRAVTG